MLARTVRGGGRRLTAPEARPKIPAMVTGFNTDVEYEGRIYHVQTEDKGVDNPIIETLVYRGGEILAALRSSYADLKEKGFGEATIGARIETQHNQVLLDVRAGKFEVRKPRPFGEGIITSRSFDEVVLDFLRSELGEDPLVVSVQEPPVLPEGSTVRLVVQLRRARSQAGVEKADVRVRLLSSAGKARVLGQGKTGADGLAAIEIAIPEIGRGAAALLIQAQAGKDVAEIKQSIGQVPARASAS